MSSEESRRKFLKQAFAMSAALTVAAPRRAPAAVQARKSPNEKLNIGCIGVAGRGAANTKAVSGENIVALCDVDRQRLATSKAAYPSADTYEDFRHLLDRPDLDAVVVSTPDHSHAIAVAWALRAGLDVYCEKPLAHTTYEVRVIRELTAEKNAVTQMGTQIHAGDNYRRVVELVKSGIIGQVGRVHVWKHGTHPAPGTVVKSSEPPKHVNYDLWLGPASERPFHPSHFHFRWRWWWDFGGGVLSDFGCHYMDLPYWALDLTAPTSIEARGRKEYDGDNHVPSVMRVDYQFPARGERPPVQLVWFHGSWSPNMYGKGSSVLFEGDRGMLLADYRTHQLFVSDLEGESVKPEPWIPSSIGHHAEWIEAVKTRGPTTCNFEYSGLLAEAVNLGNVSYRAKEKLEWDSKAFKVTNTKNADALLHKEYREGWSI